MKCDEMREEDTQKTMWGIYCSHMNQTETKLSASVYMYVVHMCMCVYYEENTLKCQWQPTTSVVQPRTATKSSSAVATVSWSNE